MTFTRTAVVSDAVGGDSVKQGCLDLDTDLTLCFTHLNTLAADLPDKIPLAKKSQPSGVCELDAAGLVPIDSVPVLPESAIPASAVCPTGTIMFWPASTAPSGWVECDGRWLSTVSYAALFAAIGGAYGSWASLFRVPDFRGYFMRGWNHGAGRDPGASTRAARGDGLSGDIVGTTQWCAVKSHTHNYKTQISLCPDGDSQVFFYPGTTDYYPLEASGAAESRPINMCLMYCIKT